MLSSQGRLAVIDLQLVMSPAFMVHLVKVETSASLNVIILLLIVSIFPRSMVFIVTSCLLPEYFNHLFLHGFSLFLTSVSVDIQKNRVNSMDREKTNREVGNQLKL